ncbi:MAG: HD-GYP domain-containing protein [Candidatus Omnitrophota bacterium]|nr:HD-GYP domain-containing protein [Candidatus Omnitrophota bacterium]
MSQAKDKERNSGVSNAFKLSMVVLLFALTAIRLAHVLYFPSIEIVSDKILLTVTLFIVVYLWTREGRDYRRLLNLHKDLQKTHEQLKASEIDTIASLIKAEEEKDGYTRGHSDRVTKISLAIAQEMDLDEEKKKLIARAGILHDIGKIGICDSILCKKEKLTDEEWDVIKSHPDKGDKILEPLKFLPKEREIILSHHERYDGKGYPRALKGEDIQIEALILAVADAFDAMNSARSYRQPLSKEAIMSELERSRGTQHSAKVMDAFLSLLKKRPELWER